MFQLVQPRSDARGWYTFWLMRFEFPIRRSARPALAAASALLVVSLAGCSKPLLSPREERSQYDRYDIARGNYQPQFIEDEFGRRKPNLRGRLAPKR